MELSTLKAILEVWDIEIPKLNDKDAIDERIKAQKLMHLLQNKLYKTDMFYGYNMYVHGPYSPGLSQSYYKLAENSKTHSKKLAVSVVKKIKIIKNECDDFSRKNGIDDYVLALEILGTTLFFAKGYSRPERVVEAVTTAKPKLKGKEKLIQMALDFLQTKDYLPSKAA